MNYHFDVNHVFLRDVGSLLLAVVLGGIIGMERSRTEHPAGLRTHMIVCIGATLITLIDRSVPNGGGRIAAQIVSGVGFLGAGTILREANGSLVRGLTTAATLWAVAAIGIAVGTGGMFEALAAVATFMLFITLGVLDNFEHFLNRNRLLQELTFAISTGDDALSRMSEILNTLQQLGIRTGTIQCTPMAGGQVIKMMVRLPSPAVREQVKPLLEANPNVVHVEWTSGH